MCENCLLQKAGQSRQQAVHVLAAVVEVSRDPHSTQLAPDQDSPAPQALVYGSGFSRQKTGVSRTGRGFPGRDDGVSQLLQAGRNPCRQLPGMFLYRIHPRPQQHIQSIVQEHHRHQAGVAGLHLLRHGPDRDLRENFHAFLRPGHQVAPAEAGCRRAILGPGAEVAGRHPMGGQHPLVRTAHAKVGQACRNLHHTRAMGSVHCQQDAPTRSLSRQAVQVQALTGVETDLAHGQHSSAAVDRSQQIFLPDFPPAMGNPSDRYALCLQRPPGVAHRGKLEAGGHDVVPGTPIETSRQPVHSLRRRGHKGHPARWGRPTTGPPFPGRPRSGRPPPRALRSPDSSSGRNRRRPTRGSSSRETLRPCRGGSGLPGRRRRPEK